LCWRNCRSGVSASLCFRGTYCAGYPHCAAGYLHRIEALFGRLHTVQTVARPEIRRSAQGGYSRTRIFKDPQDGSTIEEVELHCETLAFESLVKKRREGAKTPAATPGALHDPGFCRVRAVNEGPDLRGSLTRLAAASARS